MGLDMCMHAVKNLTADQLEAIRNTTGGEMRLPYLADIKALGIYWSESCQLSAEVAPFATELEVLVGVYDDKAIRKAFGVPGNARRTGICQTEDTIAFSYSGDGPEERYEAKIGIDDYVIYEKARYYFYNSRMIAYWRKEYNLEDYVYEVHGDVANTKMCHLEPQMFQDICQMAEDLGLAVPEPLEEGEEPFYWEWY